MEDNKNYTRSIYYILICFLIILCFTLCKILSSVILPVVFCVIFSFVLMPVIKNISQKCKIPWVLSSIIIFILFVAALFALSSLLVSGLSSIISEYPKYESKFMSIYSLIAQKFNLEIDESKSFIENLLKYLNVRDVIQKGALFLSSGVFTFGRNVLLVLLMLAFLIVELRLSTKKISYAFEGKIKSKVLRLSERIISETVRFLSIKFFISLITGLLVYLGTIIIGLDFPIVWAFLAFIMNFIPTFGSIISVLLTTVFALLQFYPGWGKIIFIFVFMTAINFILGNILEPRIEGKNLGLSPFVILVSLTLWGYLWGFVGMILAVPMTVIIKIVCENISFLHGVAIILGNDPLETKKEFFSAEK